MSVCRYTKPAISYVGHHSSYVAPPHLHQKCNINHTIQYIDCIQAVLNIIRILKFEIHYMVSPGVMATNQ